MVTYAWVSPTSSTDASAHYTNDANAYDGNYATYAFGGHEGSLPSTPYFQLNLSQLMWVDRVRFKYFLQQYAGYDDSTLWMEIDIWNESTATWDLVVKAFKETYAFLATHTILIPPTYSNKLRMTAFLCGQQVWLYELEVERVTPDDPNTPPVPDPRTIKQIIKQEKANPPLGMTRNRSIHRRTKLVPVVVS